MRDRPEQQLARAAVYTVLITVAYNIVAGFDKPSRPLLHALVALVSHFRGLTMALAAACLMINAPLLLAMIVAVILVFTWPTDLVHLGTALVAGGMIGILLRRIFEEHDARKPVHNSK